VSREVRCVKMLCNPWTIDAGASVSSSLSYDESHHEMLLILERQLFDVVLLLLKVCIISYLLSFFL